MSNLNRCLLKLANQVDATAIRAAVQLYTSRGVEDTQASIAAVQDKLNEIGAQEKRILAAVRSAWEADGKPAAAATAATSEAEPLRPAGEALKSAGKHAAAAAANWRDAATALFGSKGGTLKTGLGWDEETYAKALPIFKAGWEEAKAAAADLKEAAQAFVRNFIQQYGGKIDPKPYLMRFYGDVIKGDVENGRAGVPGQSGVSGVPGPDQAGSGGNQGRGDLAESGEGAGSAGVLAPAAPGNVGEAGAGGDRGGLGGSATGPDVAAGSNQPAGGHVPHGQPGGSGAGLATHGTGGRAPGIRGNYRITDPRALIGGTPKARFDRNKRALEVLDNLESEGREPSQEELDALARYIGWGSFGQELFNGSWERPRPKEGWEERDKWLRDQLGEEAWKSVQRSIINAHFTDPPTVTAMWDMVRRLGFKGGRVLEPSMGIGNFFGLMPADLMAASELTGIELDTITGRMAKYLYPDANIQIKGYEESKTADGFYDLVIGNWPFFERGPADRRYNKLAPTLHDYFFLKALDQVRPGGLVIGITSKGTMDKHGTATRVELAKKAELVAAFRMPTDAFQEYAGTAVVTDILIFKKRPAPLPSAGEFPWRNSVNHEYPDGEVSINEYFDRNPEDVLGTMGFGSHTTTRQPGLVVTPPENFEQKLAALPERLPVNIYEPRSKPDTTRYVTNNTKDRENSIVMGPGNELYVVRGERLAVLDDVVAYKTKNLLQTAERRGQFLGLIALRQRYGELVDAERAGAPNTEELRTRTRGAYEEFVRKYGRLNSSFALGKMRQMGEPFYPSLAALEHNVGTRADPTYVPARILSEPTLRARKVVEKPTVSDAYVQARNESLHIDPARIAELAGVTPEEASKQLLDSGAVFIAPTGEHVPADVYLSGNVRRKLREAKDALEAGNKAMAHNVAALEKVIPPTVPYFNIEANLGATWVPDLIYRDFVSHLLNLPEQRKTEVETELVAGFWKVRFAQNSGLNRAPETLRWGTPDTRFSSLLQHAFNNQTMVVRSYDPDTKSEYIDDTKTKAANDKIAEVREEFNEWIWKDAQRKVDLERTYNEIMNAIAEASYDGSFLQMSGMALRRGEDQFSLRRHQINAIWRGVLQGRGVMAHEVGTGKTYTIAGIAIEGRRYGVHSKPLIFAHNANSRTVAREIMEMYPAAKVLYIDNLSPDTIDVTMRQIANDDWDAIVVPHSLVPRFALTEATLMEMAESTIAQLEEEAIAAAAEDGESLAVWEMNDPEAMKKVRSHTAKDLVKARQTIIANIRKQAQRSSKENAIPFEELGVDAIIVDEAHIFKKPPMITRMNVKGLNKQIGNMSLSMDFLTRYVKGQRNGRGVYMFTGTPITNTIGEMFHMQRYVAHEDMNRDSVDTWDAWFNTFAASTTDVELTATGDWQPISRLQSFVNVADLRRMVSDYMDIVFADDMPEFHPRQTSTGKTRADQLTEEEEAELLNGRTENPQGRPYKKIINDSAPPSPQQATILNYLQDLARSFRNATRRDRKRFKDGGHISAPSYTNSSAAATSFDARLFDRSLPDYESSKTNRAVRNVLKHYAEHPQATQVIFMETGYSDSTERVMRDETTGFAIRDADNKSVMHVVQTVNMAKEIKAKLVAGGVKEDEIRIVNKDTSKEQRQEIADQMNAGTVRVVIGLTSTLGTGVNMQANLRAIHHLDAPWMPGELEQRNGRGWRQGNKWNTVLEYRYITEKLDGHRWQALARKDRFIKSFLRADMLTRVIEGDAASMEDEDSDILASLSEAAGDPRILLKNKLQAQVERLERKERAHAYGIEDARYQADRERKMANAQRAMLGEANQDAAAWQAYSDAGVFSINIGGQDYDKRAEADEALTEEIKAIQGAVDGKTLATIGQFKVTATWNGKADAALYLHLRGPSGSWEFVKPSMASIEAMMRRAPERVKKVEKAVLEHDDAMRRYLAVAAEPFTRAGELARKRKMLADLQRDLKDNPEPPPAWLRHGAPRETLVYVKGRPYEVEGHKWSEEGYFVVVKVGDEDVWMRYDLARDEQGMPIFDPQPFVAPTYSGLRTDANGVSWRVLRDNVQNPNDPHAPLIEVEPMEGGDPQQFVASQMGPYRPTIDPARVERNAQWEAWFNREGDAEPAPIQTAREMRVAQVRREKLRERREARAQTMAAAQGIEQQGQRMPPMKFHRGRRYPAEEVTEDTLRAAVVPLGLGNTGATIKVAGTFAALPEDIKAEARARNAMDMDGVFDPTTNTVWLVADRMRSVEYGQFVVLHELVGHFGLRGILGDALDPVLRQIYLTNAGVRAQARALQSRFGIGREEATEEVLSDWAAEGRAPNLFQRIVAAVKQWLRSHGWLPSFTNNLTDSDVLFLVAEARRYVRGESERTPRRRKIALAFSRTYQEDMEQQAAALEQAAKAAGYPSVDEWAANDIAAFLAAADAWRQEHMDTAFHRTFITATGLRVTESPTRDQARNLAARSQAGYLRGLRDSDGRLYVWDSAEAIHFQVAKMLGIPEADVIERMEFGTGEVAGLPDGTFSGEPGYGQVLSGRKGEMQVKEEEWDVEKFAKMFSRYHRPTDEVWRKPAQEITSAATSLAQVPAVAKTIPVTAGMVVADIGGGRYDLTTTYFAERGATNIVYDPFNRSDAHNRDATVRIRSGQADVSLVANVLNVVREAENRDLVIRQAADALKEGGVAYFQIYEGDGSGAGKRTPKGWQEHRKAATYEPEIAKHFANVRRQGAVLVATEPVYRHEHDTAHPDYQGKLFAFHRGGGTATVPPRSFVRAPIDAAFRLAGGGALARFVTRPAARFVARWMDKWIPERVKAGVVSDYGIPEHVLQARSDAFASIQAGYRQAGSIVDQLRELTREQSRVAYLWLSGRASNADFDALPDEQKELLRSLRSSITDMGAEAVRLGILSRESFERNADAYLHRTYYKYEMPAGGAMSGAERAKRVRAIRIIGNQFKGRGMFDDITMSRIRWPDEEMGIRREGAKADRALKGKKFIRFAKRQRMDDRTGTLEGFEIPAGQENAGKLLRYEFWPADMPVPARYGEWVNEGVWEVRSFPDDTHLTMWRDFTEDELLRMGEIQEAKYAVARTMMNMVHDLEIAKFFEHLAADTSVSKLIPSPDMMVVAKDDARLESLASVFRPDEWVRVPETKIPGTQVHKYGALAGRYVLGPVWNDIRQIARANRQPLGETFDAVMRAWKINKTARSPVVHMNNVMANWMLADWHDVGASDVAQALRIIANRDKDEESGELFRRFQDSGATQGMFAQHELKSETIEPLLAELQAEIQAADPQTALMQAGNVVSLLVHGQFKDAWAAASQSRAAGTLRAFDAKLTRAYELEDEIFRMAAFVKKLREGASDLDAGRFARSAFLDYQINAPWIEFARRTFLPFIGFPYRAIPMLVDTAINKPWKLIKLATIAGLLNSLAYAALGLDDDDEERERAFMPPQKAGRIWGVVPRLMRMPWNDAHDQPVFLDVRRWVVLGDLLDVESTNTAFPMLPSIVPGGPLALLAELYLNRSSFTGKAITDDTQTATEKLAAIGEHLYRSFAPNAPWIAGSYSWGSLADAGRGRTDVFGREQSGTQAVLSAAGIKLGSYPTDVLQYNESRRIGALQAQLVSQARALSRQAARHQISQEDYEAELAAIMEKRRRLAEELRMPTA